MAKFNLQTAFSNAIITKEDDVFWLEEFKVNKDGDETSLGRFNLTDQLNGIVDTKYITLAFTVKTELESVEE